MFFLSCYLFQNVSFRIFQSLFIQSVSPPYKYFRIKRAVYLWLEILDESLLY
nr:MAG TPA: hypothetical protein [Caudoviricetes sp.]